MRQRGQWISERECVLTKVGDLSEIVDASEAPSEDLLHVVVIDTETTGVTPRDKVIEVATVGLVIERRTGRLLSATPITSEFDDPGIPIPAEATEIHGITDDDVRGHKLDEDRLTWMIENASFVVAHMASFDRPKLVARVPAIDAIKTPWVCSCREIPWASYGHKHADLETLARDHGWIYDAHRAAADVRALVHVLAMPVDETGADDATYLLHLWERAIAPVHELMLAGKTYACKEALKKVGFGWDDLTKTWSKRAPHTTFEREREAAAEIARRFGLSLGLGVVSRQDVYREGVRPRLTW